MTDTPKAGDFLKMSDFDDILEAIQVRQINFPDEPAVVSMGVVMLNIGDRYSPVTCVEGEWGSVKAAIVVTDGPPTCPNGHPLVQGFGLKLGWLQDGEEEIAALLEEGVEDISDFDE